MNVNSSITKQENKEGLELLKTAIEKAGYTGKVISIELPFILSFSLSFTLVSTIVPTSNT
jgi:enolase